MFAQTIYDQAEALEFTVALLIKVAVFLNGFEGFSQKSLLDHGEFIA